MSGILFVCVCRGVSFVARDVCMVIRVLREHSPAGVHSS